MLECLCVHALCQSRTAFFGGSGYGAKDAGEVVPCYLPPWGIQGIPKEFSPFYLQLSATMAQARLSYSPVLGGTCGPEAWATSAPSHDKMSDLD